MLLIVLILVQSKNMENTEYFTKIFSFVSSNVVEARLLFELRYNLNYFSILQITEHFIIFIKRSTVCLVISVNTKIKIIPQR